MTDRELFEVLRQKALRLVREAQSELELHPDNKSGSMYPHVAQEKISKLRRVAKKFEAMANLADAL